eukprot:TRINITY_DN9366_c0_g1_i1.p2 TRINITY_DN9366_c0_g1~~TRINITY_DN9366_c0_g1_i1.p2  ORF type:complete len:204 (+),score=60.36 TRINITY_DN9366_c0_g1_i1:58-669(+)
MQALSAVLAELALDKSTRVRASHADHSPLMAPISPALLSHAQEAGPAWALDPSIKFASTVTGSILEGSVDAQHWVKHSEGTVRFSAAFDAVLAYQRESTPMHEQEVDPLLYCLDIGEGMMARFAIECAGGKEQAAELGVVAAACLGVAEQGAVFEEAVGGCMERVRQQSMNAFLIDPMEAALPLGFEALMAEFEQQPGAVLAQ